MRLRHRLALGPMLLMALAGFSLGPAGITASAAVTYTIGVDNATPASHLLMYTDFFPRGGVSVSTNDIVDFKWNTGSPDGFHTVTLAATGETAAMVYNDPALTAVVADADDGASTTMENPAVDAPSDPTCGTVGTPCSYTGARLNSGAFPTAPGKDFFVTLTTPGIVTFLCLIHPGMVGTVNVIAPDGVSPSTPADFAAAALAQYAADTTEAVAAAAAVTVPAATTNTNGSKTFNVQAGAEAPHEQVLEFFPSSLSITPGDSVKWTSKAHDIHTATFPSGAASAAVDFHHFVCEPTPDTSPDTPATSPASCTSPPAFESHFTGGPVGGTTLATPTTVATSGIIAAAPAPFPDQFTFAVASAGTYAYQCKVHDHMTGQVLAAAVTPTLPASGRGPTVQPAGDPDNNAPITALVVFSLAILVGLSIRGVRLPD